MCPEVTGHRVKPFVWVRRTSQDVPCAGGGELVTSRVNKGLTRHPYGLRACGRTIGARALLVHAMDDEATAFYKHFTFEASPSDQTICCSS